jgi:tyrosinase
MAAYSTPRRLTALLLTLVLLVHTTVSIQHGAHHKHLAHRSTDAVEANAHEARSLEERANNIAIRGAPDGQHSRLEIREMQGNADQWNLFLLAMERFKAKPRSDRMSYYQIAGVHGRPFVTWNNFGPLVNAAGFCPHSQCLFGTWHRPYLALFEQALYLNAEEVISTFPSNQQQRWRNALVGLRLPYFDWAVAPASGQPNVPASLRDENVSVTKPNGRVTIPNPLYSYSFGSSLPSEMGGGPSNNFPATLRRPLSNPTRSNNNEMNVLFGQARVGWRQRIFALFASKQSWGRASTSQFGVRTSRRNSDSFEAVHDEIHSTVGGNNGHMSYLDYAAFDPFFFIHHANVDRLLAMLQWTSPYTYVVEGAINRPMAQWNAGEVKNENSPLKPFTKDTTGNFFTSVDVTQTRSLGYFYPETASRQAGDVIAAINRLYGQGETPITKRHEHGHEEKTEADSVYPGRPFKHGDYDVVLAVTGDKYAVSGSYQVRCYLGGKPSTNKTVHHITHSTGYGYGKGFVGSHGFLGGSAAGGNTTGPVLVEGSIPLTAALQEKEAYGELESLHPEHVEPYLKEHLSYKIIGPDGEEINPKSLPDFHVKVKACSVTPDSEYGLPTFGDYTELHKVTLPASEPWTYAPGPYDVVPPTAEEPGSSPTENPVSYPTGSIPNPVSLPWEEPGYCVIKQTIQYVDPEGKLLYAEAS